MASRRNYVTTTEVDELIGSGNSTDLQISEAEELIDAYVGHQDKFYNWELTGRSPSAGGASSITLQTNQQNIYDIDYFKWCEVEIIGGTGVGQRRIITASTKAGVLTVASAWTTTPDSTSFYKIYQLGKFPRKQDVMFYSEQTPSTYYKQIPEAVKRATAAQVEFMSQMGDEYFKTDRVDKVSERIGDYAYENANSQGVGFTGAEKLIAPKAKILLRGIRSRIGSIVA